MKFVIIVIVCAIFAFICQPLVDKVIKKRLPANKGLASFLLFMVYWVIFIALYGIAALLGFNISD